MKNVVLFGATSAIAQAAARRYAAEGAAFHLVGRDGAKLDAMAQDLRARGAAAVTTDAVDLGRLDELPGVVARLESRVSALDVVILAHGVLGDQATAQASFAAAEGIFRVNFLSYVALLTPLANIMERQRHGAIVVISSVAGDRGRQSNYVYGSSKAALSTFCAGLRNRLYRAGVQVVTIKPGFVSTPMTAHLDQGPLYASPEVVGAGIQRAVAMKRDVAYLPGFWLLIMLVIKAIPEAFFKRLKL